MYFKIFVSSIYTAQNNGFMSDVWKVLSNFYVAVAMTCNLLMLYLLINTHIFPNSLDMFIIRYTFVGKYNFMLNIFITCIIPLMILNYYKVYRKNNYKKLILRYPQYYNKNLFVIYFLISFLLPLIYVFAQIEIRW